jgi:tripartite-type tricarboxylate transporter receptor subunit TctC
MLAPDARIDAAPTNADAMRADTMPDIFRFIVLGWAALLPCAPVHAQTYPARPIRIVVPYLAGGAADVVARLVGQKMFEAFGQPVLVDNRAGGAATIGSDFVAKAPADGYTLLMGSPANVVNVSLFAKLPYDIMKDLAPVVLMGTSANILVVHPSLPVKSVRELIAFARARPGQLTYASSGNASSNHLSGELFRTLAHVDLVHVPYKGGGPAVTDLLGGQVTMYFSSLPSALPFARNGKLRALGVTSAIRAAAAPDLPTIAEAGLPGYAFVAWHALLAPAGTPQNVIDKLNAGIVRIVHHPDTRSRLEHQGVDIVGGTPGELAVFLKDEIEKCARLVKAAGIRIE